MKNEQRFGDCVLRNVDCWGGVRWILDIPKAKFDNLIVGDRDRDQTDALRRLYRGVTGTYPFWHTNHRETYAIEFQPSATDEMVQQLVDLINQNQESPPPPLRLTHLSTKTTVSVKKPWWRAFLKL